MVVSCGKNLKSVLCCLWFIEVCGGTQYRRKVAPGRSEAWELWVKMCNACMCVSCRVVFVCMEVCGFDGCMCVESVVVIA